MNRRICIALLALAPVALASAAPRTFVHEGFRTPHVVFDARFNHDHYYPAPGYRVGALPPGHVALDFRGGHYFFHSGVWYEGVSGAFAVVRPPIGIVIPVLPPAYTTVWAGGVPYYYANDVYYIAAPGGYAVAQPPADGAGAPTRTGARGPHRSHRGRRRARSRRCGAPG